MGTRAEDDMDDAMEDDMEGDIEEDIEDYPDVRTKDLLVVHIPELKVSADNLYSFIESYLTIFVDSS